MNNYKHLKNVLNYSIKKLFVIRSISCENPESNFTRHRKIDFEITIKNIISMKTGSLKDELLKINDFSLESPTAFIQAKDKTKVYAFKTLFNNFNKNTHVDNLFKGFRLLTIDGSVLPINNTIYDKKQLSLIIVPKPNLILHMVMIYQNVPMTILLYREK